MLLIFFIHSFPVFPVLYYIPLDQRNKKKERKKKKKRNWNNSHKVLYTKEINRNR